MKITKVRLAQMLCWAARDLQKNSGMLSEIDSRFGDGDHGVTIGKIAGLILDQAGNWKDQTIGQFLEQLGESITNVGGGSAGPLWGTLLSGLAEPAKDCDQVDGTILKNMFRSSLAEMEEITPARVGSKTMMDAFIPAVEAAEKAEDDPEKILEAAALAAAAGAKATEGFVASFGRARSYKEQTIGTPDAGATSVAMLLDGLWEGYKNEGGSDHGNEEIHQ